MLFVITERPGSECARWMTGSNATVVSTSTTVKFLGPCCARCRWLTDAEVATIVSFHGEHPLEGYRRPARLVAVERTPCELRHEHHSKRQRESPPASH